MWVPPLNVNNKPVNEFKETASNPSQNMLRPIYEIKLNRTFMESLTADFIQSFCVVTFFWGGGGGGRGGEDNDLVTQGDTYAQ